VTELNHWPKCTKCQRPVDRYRAECKDVAACVLVVHAECHGKRASVELGLMTAKLMMGPLEMFQE